MPHSFGYRARTRQMFAKDFRKHGVIGLNKYLTNYKIGDIVDVKGDGAVQKGMPHKYYHGKTGVIWNVTKRAVGVCLNKRVGHRIMKKRIHVRVEHIKQSACKKEFHDRVKANEAAKAAAKANGTVAVTKRQPAGPRPAQFVKNADIETLHPQVYGGILSTARD